MHIFAHCWLSWLTDFHEGGQISCDITHFMVENSLVWELAQYVPEALSARLNDDSLPVVEVDRVRLVDGIEPTDVHEKLIFGIDTDTSKGPQDSTQSKAPY